MDEGIEQRDDALNDSQIDLERIRESRLQRTREAMMEFDRGIAVSVIPENNRDDAPSVAEKAAICIQKHFRGYLGRQQYRKKLLEQYEKDEDERQKRQKQQTEEAEILVEMARLQLEAEEDDTIHRNRQRMLNVYATRIQRAWRQYRANRPTQLTHHSDSFEEQVYHATGLNVTDVITSNNSTSNVALTNTAPYQSETIETHKTSPTLHGSEVNNEACMSEALVEDTIESSNHKIEGMQVIDGSNSAMDNTSESNSVEEDIVSKSSPKNADTTEEVHQQQGDATPNSILQEKDSTNEDLVQEDTVTKDTIQEVDTGSDHVITQKGERKVRFNLQDTEDKEHSTFTHDTLQSVIAANNELVTSAASENSDSEFVSSEEVSFTMSAEQVKQLGYTQLRELKCSLETKLGSLSDELITELQSRDRLLAHKDFLMEKIQNLSKLVQNQHKINQKHRKRIKSSGH